MSTVTRDLPFVAAFRQTVGSPLKFPPSTSLLVKPLHVHLLALFAAPFGARGDR
jgi:hypothetical protein